MNSRERVQNALDHKTPDRVPVDMGSTATSGINASTLYKLRNYLGLPERPIDIEDPFQLLGSVDNEVRSTLNIDVIGLWNPVNFFGTSNLKKKPWHMPDGTPVRISSTMKFTEDEKGTIYTYPQGDDTVPPSGRLPAGGSFFDNIDRSGEFDEENLTPLEDYQDSFSIFSDETARYFEEEAKRLYEETDYAIIANFGGGAFGDVAILPGAFLKAPKGIRRMEDWLMAHILYPDYIKEVFSMQLETALKNLEILKQAVGDRVCAITISGTDFGTQNSEFMSVEQYRDIYKPFHEKINGWVHQNTNWKTFYHSCGSIPNLLPDLIDSGVDILNPVQCSATGMDARFLKDTYGDKLVFWGGGVDTQHTLPFGTPEEVYSRVKNRLSIFSENGGFVFNTIHNIVAKTPVENIAAMFEAIKDFNEGK